MTEQKTQISRRGLLGATAGGVAIGGLGMRGTAALLAGGGAAVVPAAAMAAGAEANWNPQPGELDEYYGFWSSGQTGEMRILGSGDPVEVALLSCDGGQEMDRVRLSAAEAATIANR